MNLKTTHNPDTLSGQILGVLSSILLSVLGIQILLVLAPVHNCEKRFKL